MFFEARKQNIAFKPYEVEDFSDWMVSVYLHLDQYLRLCKHCINICKMS
jgi:hypothetical protein